MAAGFKSATVNAASVPSTATNFPAYVDLSRLGITTLAEAQSVRVYADSAKTTEWAREIVSATQMHVKVPSLTSTVTMYVDWDGVSADYATTDTYGRNAVWGAYRAIYHLEGTAGSTASSTTLTNENTVTFTSSKITDGSSTSTGNTNKQLNTGTTELISNAEVTSTWAVSGWVTFNTLPSTGDGDTRWVQCFNASVGGATRKFANLVYDGRVTNQGFRIRLDGSSVIFYNSATTTTVNTPVFYVMQYTGSNIQLYLNASSAINSAHTWTDQGFAATARRYQLHMVDTYSGGASSSKIDENRVLIGNYSANWITTEYNNQNDEATFWGTWTTVGGGGGSPTPLLSLMGVGS